MVARGGPFFANEFGAVYEDRVCFNLRSGSMSGGGREELAVRHITSVRSGVDRSSGLGGFLALLFGVGFFVAGCQSANPLALIIGLALPAIGAYKMAGQPFITINMSGGDRRRLVGGPFQKAAARDFARAVSRALFQE
jgi:hypothetical protein